MARAMILHASIHWKGGIDSSLWPMAVDYATYVYNHSPNSNGVCPADIFTGSTIPRHRLRDLHVWGCPVYILDPKLQAGQKLPRWQPRSRCGVFLGLSTIHSSEVPRVLNRQTGRITTQFHVVFDDLFSTVASIAREDEPPDHWEALCLENLILIPLEPGQDVHLHDDWLTQPELERKRRDLQHREKVRGTFLPPPTLPARTESSTEPIRNPEPEGAGFVPEGAPAPTPAPRPVPAPTPPPPTPTIGHPAAGPIAPPPVVPTEGAEGLRRSSRSTKGQYQSTKYHEEVFLTQVVPDNDVYGNAAQAAYLAELYTDQDTGICDITDPRVYAAKTKKGFDPDQPSFHQAINGEFAEQYLEAMKIEVSALLQQKTWTMRPRGEAANVLKSTWAFKLKRLPDGTPSKFKARFCCRGDLQKEGIDYFETYAPVVSWSTIRLLLSTVLQEEWTTRQVDYTNAFAQAELNEAVYIEPPKLFAAKSKKDLVLKLRKSLYGLKQAPRTFYEKLREGLLERGWKQSTMDPCLFMKKGIICVVYVDDAIFGGKNGDDLEREITSLGVAAHEQRHKFELRNEGEVGNFLGIQIKKTGPREFYLRQPGLTDKVLKATGMDDCRGVPTPAIDKPIGANKDGDPFDEHWEYSSVIGMLMYLAANSRPDIAHSVHQAARFTHAPRDLHATAVKQILRYLKDTRDKGLIITPNKDHRVDCYVDADFAGLFGSEYDQDPVSVKSRTGYVIMCCGVPILWVSKLQTQVALSTMEAEYIALSQSMRDLIPIREILKEFMTIVFTKQQGTIPAAVESKAFKDASGTADTFTPEEDAANGVIPQSHVYEDNQACLKFARMPKLSPRTKHIGIPCHWFRTKVEALEIAIKPVSTDSQLGDQFTKGLPTDKFRLARKALMGW